MRVLIVDDDKLVAISLKTILEGDEGIEVLAIGNNGKDAVELYRNNQPDILLMDIRMEKMTGIEASISLIEKYPDIRILFLLHYFPPVICISHQQSEDKIIGK